MTEFLLQNDANIDARTFGDEQAAIHYAAKNGAVQSLNVLLGYHANIDSLDANKKTPLQVSFSNILTCCLFSVISSASLSIQYSEYNNHIASTCCIITRLQHL